VPPIQNQLVIVDKVADVKKNVITYTLRQAT
jgi:hypothetical protein